MHRNFWSTDVVAELGDAQSYATRLFDYGQTGRDQIAWVVERLRRDPESRSAAITTFQPLTDTSYIPCVSLLDFWLDGGELELVVYAHSLDFGKKAYGNLIELDAPRGARRRRSSASRSARSSCTRSRRTSTSPSGPRWPISRGSRSPPR